jgi:hypothetical protein
MVIQFCQEGEDYIAAHGEKLNVKQYCAKRELEQCTHELTARRYADEVREFRRDHPEVRPTSIELRQQVPPTEWAAYKGSRRAKKEIIEVSDEEEEESPRRKAKQSSQGIMASLVRQLNEQQEENRQLRATLDKLIAKLGSE